MRVVEHEIVAVAEHFARIALDEREAVVVRARERVVRRDPALAIVVVLEERRVHDPEKLEFSAVSAVWNQTEFLREMNAQIRENGLNCAFFSELEEEKVVFLRADLRIDCVTKLG